MHAVMLYLTMSATLCALRTVTTVLFIPGAATRGAEADPTVKFRLMAVDRSSPSWNSLICTPTNKMRGNRLAAVCCTATLKVVFWVAQLMPDTSGELNKLYNGKMSRDDRKALTGMYVPGSIWYSRMGTLHGQAE